MKQNTILAIAIVCMGFVAVTQCPLEERLAAQKDTLSHIKSKILSDKCQDLNECGNCDGCGNCNGCTDR